jgi:outer membrane lipase/esterase
MTVLRDPCRAGARLLAPLALTAMIVTACGGGTEPVQAYRPNRLVVFGDETSALVDDGNQNAWKYTVNGIDPITNVRDCNLLQNWVQVLAAAYGFVFAECNPGGVTSPKAVMRAQPGARVEDPAIGLEQQISTELGNGLGTGDLVTVMIGANDIVDLYNQIQNGTLSQPDAIAEARRRGAVTAGQVNRLLAINTRVILATVPDMGKTPFAVSADKLVAGSSGLLYNLTYEYNAYLRTSIDSAKYDGRNYGLVLADDMVGAAVSSPTSYLTAPANVTDPLCVVALPFCTSAPSDLSTDPGASTNSYLWADELRVGPTMHSRMGSSAVARATTNPF